MRPAGVRLSFDHRTRRSGHEHQHGVFAKPHTLTEYRGARRIDDHRLRKGARTIAAGISALLWTELDSDDESVVELIRQQPRSRVQESRLAL